MTGPKHTASSFDDNFVFEETLERALNHGDNSSVLIVPALAELPGLVNLAQRVKAVGRTVEPSDVFRAAARRRLCASMRATAGSSKSRPRPVGRIQLAVSSWYVRTAAGLSALVLAGAATASASASALPGDPLYALKQTTEQVALQTAPDDSVRQQRLLLQAQTRLEETSQLISQGRAADAGQNALRYSATLDQAAEFAGTTQPTEPTTLQSDRARIAGLLADAPLPARAGLQRALQATERGLTRTQRPTPYNRATPPTDIEPAVVQRTADPAPEAVPTPSPAARTPAIEATPREDRPTPRSHEAAPEVNAEASSAEVPAVARGHQAAAAEAEQVQTSSAPAIVADHQAAGGAPKSVEPPGHPAPPVPRTASPHVDQARPRHGH